MKCNKLKNQGFFLLVLLFACGCTGCSKTSDSVPILTDRLTPTVSVLPTEVMTTPTSEATNAPTTTPTPKVPTPTTLPSPAVTLTPEPIVFPADINETTFPELLLRKKAQAADSNEDGLLSKEEASAVTKLSLKKLADTDAKDAMEDEPLPEYTTEDFTFDFEGIQYFTELSELTVNLLGGEAFVAEGTEEILVSTTHFNRIYECTKLKKLVLYETDISSLELSPFINLKQLELNHMYNLTSLNLGSHAKLSALWISECHKLETVDLSELNSLKTLDIVMNDEINEVIFGKANEKLETIQLNGLKSLCEINISYLENLKSLNLMDVSLRSLDVTKNIALEQLCAEGLHLATLDLSTNPNISYLINAKDSFTSILLPKDNCVSMIRWTNSVVTEFPIANLNPETLTGIDIQGTAIKELDVRPYPNLVHLYYDESITKILR